MEDSLEKLCISFIVSLKLVYIFRRIKVEDTMYIIYVQGRKNVESNFFFTKKSEMRTWTHSTSTII